MVTTEVFTPATNAHSLFINLSKQVQCPSMSLQHLIQVEVNL